MTFNTFTSGIDTSFSTKLNQNFGFSGYGNIRGTLSPLGRACYNHAFTSNDAATSTNFSYDSTDDNYVVLGTSAGTLITETVLSSSMIGRNIGSKINIGVVSWDYYIFTVYDECADSSFNTSLWTANTGTPSENTDRWSVSGSSGGALSVSSDTSFRSDLAVIFRTTFSTNGGGNGAKTGGIYVSDGSTDIELDYDSQSGTTPLNITGTYVLHMDATNSKIYAYKNGSYHRTLDMSTVTNNWYIYWKSGTTLASEVFTAECYYLRRITGSETTTVTQSFSSNNGSDYYTVSNNVVSITNTGYQMVAKLTTTPASGEGVAVARIDFQGFTANES